MIVFEECVAMRAVGQGCESQHCLPSELARRRVRGWVRVEV